MRSRKFPSSSETATAVSPIMTEPSFIFFVRSRMTAFRAVPALLPFVPWLAIAMSRAVVVSMDCPEVPIVAATFSNASPSPSAVVFALLCA